MDVVQVVIKGRLDISIIILWFIILLGVITTVAYWYKRDQNKENFWLLITADVSAALMLWQAKTPVLLYSRLLYGASRTKRMTLHPIVLLLR